MGHTHRQGGLTLLRRRINVSAALGRPTWSEAENFPRPFGPSLNSKLIKNSRGRPPSSRPRLILSPGLSAAQKPGTQGPQMLQKRTGLGFPEHSLRTRIPGMTKRSDAPSRSGPASRVPRTFVVPSAGRPKTVVSLSGRHRVVGFWNAQLVQHPSISWRHSCCAGRVPGGTFFPGNRAPCDVAVITFGLAFVVGSSFAGRPSSHQPPQPLQVHLPAP